MLRLLNQYSKARIAWSLLMLSAFIFEGVALYFQHVLKLDPCTLCIYQRCAILGIALAGLVGMIKPKLLVLRMIAILIWLFSSFEGFKLAYQQARLQFQPSISDFCTINVQFPRWMPLNEWFPNLFNATGSCAEKLWSFLTIEMSQWMVIIFSCYIIVTLLILMAQFFPTKKRSLY